MARFAANLSFLFTELPMVQRFAAARAAGFEGVEILFPYDFATAELSLAALRQGLQVVMLNTPPPNWSGGPRGFAAEPGREARFRHDFDRALRFAEALRVRHIHVMAGKAKGERAMGVFVDNLRWAAERAPHASLLIEPCNAVDLPGYFLSDFDQAAAVIEAVGAPNLGLLFDAYHAHMIAANPAGAQDQGQAQQQAQAPSEAETELREAAVAAGAGPAVPRVSLAVDGDPIILSMANGNGAAIEAPAVPHRRQPDVEALWARHHPLVRHVQVAGAPGRHEPRGGEIDYASFFRAVDAAGYRGWVSAEYSPRTNTQDGLRWLRGSAKG